MSAGTTSAAEPGQPGIYITFHALPITSNTMILHLPMVRHHLNCLSSTVQTCLEVLPGTLSHPTSDLGPAARAHAAQGMDVQHSMHLGEPCILPKCTAACWKGGCSTAVSMLRQELPSAQSVATAICVLLCNGENQHAAASSSVGLPGYPADELMIR